jgi:thiol-disulfide isomerase/thioredoxin
MLCIAVLAALLINTIVSISYLNSPAVPNRNILIEAAAFILLSAIVLSAWLILKSLFQKGIRSLDNEIKTKRLKRNPEIFNALLEKEIANPLNLPEKNEAIHFGSPTAPYQLLIACNPYCGPCAKAHHAIETIYQKYPEDLSITIRFALQNNNETDSKVIAVKEIMRAAKEKPFEAIRDWYNVLNLDKFKEKHHTNGTDINGAIDKQIEWGKAAEIKATPTIFVNGRRLPELYSWVDFVETLEFEVKK